MNIRRLLAIMITLTLLMAMLMTGCIGANTQSGNDAGNQAMGEVTTSKAPDPVNMRVMVGTGTTSEG